MNKNILIIAVVWWVHLNAYFGWNWKPNSIEELAADGFGLLLFALSFLKMTTISIEDNR